MFSQVARWDLAVVRERALRDAGVALEVLWAVAGPFGDRVALRATRSDVAATMELVPRAVLEEDLAAADAAEERGAAAGMAALARRCRVLIELTPLDAASPPLVLEVAAALASVTLGPILPPDRDTLFGVRGARERARALDTR